MPKPLTPYERRLYDAQRHYLRARMRACPHTGRRRTTLARLCARMDAQGNARSARVVRAVLAGEKTSRPVLRDVGAALD